MAVSALSVDLPISPAWTKSLKKLPLTAGLMATSGCKDRHWATKGCQTHPLKQLSDVRFGSPIVSRSRPINGCPKAAAISIIESTKQQFFGQLPISTTRPSLIPAVALCSVASRACHQVSTRAVLKAADVGGQRLLKERRYPFRRSKIVFWSPSVSSTPLIMRPPTNHFAPCGICRVAARLI